MFSKESQLIFLVNGLIWLICAFGVWKYSNAKNYYAATFLAFMLLQVVICLIIGLILGFMSKHEFRKSFFLTAVVFAILTFIASGMLFDFR